MTVSGGMPTALDMAALYEAAAGLASFGKESRAAGSGRGPLFGPSVGSGPCAGPGARGAARAFCLRRWSCAKRRRLSGVSAAESGLAAGGGWRASRWGSSKGDLGRGGRRSGPRVKAARTWLPGWELAVDSGELGSSHLSPPAVIEHPRALGQRWTDGLRRLAPPRPVHSGPRGSIYREVRQTQH